MEGKPTQYTISSEIRITIPEDEKCLEILVIMFREDLNMIQKKKKQIKKYKLKYFLVTYLKITLKV